MASKLTSKLSFHLEKSLSATTATTNDCAVLKTHCAAVTRILSGHSSSNGACVVIRKDPQQGSRINSVGLQKTRIMVSDEAVLCCSCIA